MEDFCVGPSLCPSQTTDPFLQQKTPHPNDQFRSVEEHSLSQNLSQGRLTLPSKQEIPTEAILEPLTDRHLDCTLLAC